MEPLGSSLRGSYFYSPFPRPEGLREGEREEELAL